MPDAAGSAGSTDDDEPEIEVTALPTPLPRRPRVANPEVDNVIASGEIVPRSHIARSTAPTLEPSPVAPAFSPRPWLWLVAAAIPALAVVILTFARPRSTSVQLPTTDLEAVAELIGSTFDNDARAAQVRAESIASSSMLRAGIEADAQTLADMTHNPTAVFPISGAESVEVFQLREGVRTSLLRVPEQAAATKPPAQGSARLEARGQVPTVVVDVPITSQAGAIAGELVLAAPVDLARIKAHVPARAISASIAGFGAPLGLGDSTGQAGQRLSLPIHTTLATPAPLLLTYVLAAAPLPELPMWYRAGRGVGVGLAALFALVFFSSLRPRHRAGSAD